MNIIENVKALYMVQKINEEKNKISYSKDDLEISNAVLMYHIFNLNHFLISCFKGTTQDFNFIMNKIHNVPLEKELRLKIKKEYNFTLLEPETNSHHKIIFFEFLKYEDVLYLTKIKDIFENLHGNTGNLDIIMCKFCIHNEKNKVFLKNINLIKSKNGFRVGNVENLGNNVFFEWTEVVLFIEKLYNGNFNFK